MAKSEVRSEAPGGPGGLTTITGALLLSLLVCAPIALGSVHPVPRTCVFLACGVLFALAIAERWQSKRPLPVPLPALAFMLLLGATLFQLLPLPSQLVAALSPEAHSIFEYQFGEDYGFRALTLSPSESWQEIAKLSAYVAFFLGTTSYLSRSHRRRRVLIAIAGTATLVTLLGFVDLILSGSKRLLFFYVPDGQVQSEILVRGTFVNPNHYGALLILGAACALALGLREPKSRIPAFIAVVLLNLGIVLSLSRSALIAGPLAQAITFGIDRWQLGRGFDRPTKNGGPYRVALLLIVLASLAMGLAIVLKRYEPGEPTPDKPPAYSVESKLEVIQAAAVTAWSYPWTGVGRGSLEHALPRASTLSYEMRFRWAENFYVQVFADWGFPIGLLFFLLLGRSLLVALRSIGPDPLAAGALGGLVALMIHEAVDFSVEIPGVGLPALALAACLFGQRRVRDSETGARWTPRLAIWLAPLAVCAAAFIPILVKDTNQDLADLTEKTRDPRATVAQVIAEGERLRTRHPAHYFPPLAVGERLARNRHPDTVGWLNDAMFLHPRHPTPHLVAGELLAVLGRRRQALLEFRAAMELGWPSHDLWDRVDRHYPDVEALTFVTPREPDFLRRLGNRLSRKNPAAARVVLNALLDADPSNVETNRVLLRISIDQSDKAQAVAGAERLLSVSQTTDSRLLVAEAYLLGGKLPLVETVLNGLIERSNQSFLLDIRLADAYLANGDVTRARQRLERLHWQSQARFRAILHEAKARAERSAGNEHQYRWELEQAKRLKGEEP